MYKYTFTFILVLIAGLASGQGWERVYGGSGQDVANGVTQTPDGGYILTGSYNADTRVYLLKTDANGELQWSKTFFGSPLAAGNKVIVTQDGGYAVVGYVKGEGPNGDNIYVLKTDAFGTLLWKKPFGTGLDDRGTDILEMPDGNLVISGYQVNANGKADLVVLKLDSDGAEIWYKTYGATGFSEKGMGIARASNGDLIVVAEKQETISDDKDIYVTRIAGTDGALVWENTFGLTNTGTGQSGDELPRAIVTTASDDLVMTGFTSSITGGAGFIMKIDGNGFAIPLWTRTFPSADFNDIANGANNTLFICGYKSVNGLDDMYIVHTDADGGVIWEPRIGKGGFDAGLGIVATADGGAAIAGRSEQFVGPTVESKVYLVKTDANGLIFTSYLEGHIFKDANLNCVRDNGEGNQENWIVKVEDGGFVRYAVAKSDGSFTMAVDTGTYDITLITPNNYWQTCEDAITVVVPAFYDTVLADIPVQVKSACPRNEVDIATPVLRRCAENTYTVRYCNSGTVTSSNTFVEVKLDPAFTVTGGSIFGSPMGDNTYRYNVGTLQNGNCGSFTVKAYLGCDETVPGGTQCVTAHIYPDSFCNVQTSNWDGAIIVAQGICENDSVKLILANVGPGNMSTTLGFVIAEDVVMLTAPGDPDYQFQLTSGESQTVWDTIANGKTYRIIAQQSPGYPGLNTPTAAVEGCQSDTSTFPISMGFYTMFPEGDADAFEESDCQENFEADYNPAYLKRGHPKGYNEEHFVTPDTDLEFLIQFQNTGTDVVQQVVIIDTLSAALDPATVYPGAASHPYQFDIYGEGVVQFTLSNVNLAPGSSAGEGYIKFRVAQRSGLPCETQILNSAAIYFDFGAPEMSNQTLHTVCEFDSFVIVKNKEIFLPNADLRVYPNPARDVVNFELSGVEARQYSLQLYDIQGRLLVNQIFNQPTFRLFRPQLPAGTLFYWLAADGKPVASGKLLIR
ncbi:MAG: T9SS type A sorting domain-containing protein [Saprospiraceae bacterium]|nr:T9SS type A sorting domain-containing protein [Saprospiraceae bacterium]